MPSVDASSLREEFDAVNEHIASLRQAGKISGEADAAIGVLCSLLSILIVVFLEKTTKKTGKNSSIPPSQTDKDETKKRRNSGKGIQSNQMTGDNLRKVTVEEESTVDTCDGCGADLSGVAPSAHEKRVLLDIVFEVIETEVAAEIKQCPKCRTQTKGRFPDNMPGPLQYGVGFQAFVINLVVAQMLSLRRAVELVYAISGRKLSEATCLGYIQRLYDSLEEWETAAADYLLTCPALHADETGFRVDSKTQWLHVLTNGSLTLKFLHRKRGKEAIEAVGIIPCYIGVLIHDCWASYLTYSQCKHQLCGSHLLRELTFVVDSNNYRWARAMKKLLRMACHKVNNSQSGVLSEAQCRTIRQRYRTILREGAKEMPDIPPNPKGRRGKVAKSDAHNLHERLLKYEDSVLRFMSEPDVSFTNNEGERKIRMAKVKMKVSGCFRTERYAHAWCRISSYLSSMAALGYNPLVAIQIALAGNTADMIKSHHEYDQAA